MPRRCKKKRTPWRAPITVAAVVHDLDLTADKPPDELAALYDTPELWASLCRRLTKNRERRREHGDAIRQAYCQMLYEWSREEVESDRQLAHETEILRQRMAKCQTIWKTACAPPACGQRANVADETQ
jgi:hypothetical protein